MYSELIKGSSNSSCCCACIKVTALIFIGVKIDQLISRKGVQLYTGVFETSLIKHIM